MNEVPRCLDSRSGECSGGVEYREAISGTGKRYPRCDAHFQKAYARFRNVQRQYPVNAPSDFDPSYAGERWNED